jgi:hypothetical protein
MKLDKKLYGSAIGAAWTFTLATQAYGSEISINSLRNYIKSSSITADPGIMVMVGVGLITLRVLIARRSKRREKDPTRS